MIWTERKIAAWLARWFFGRRYLLVLPNPYWTGHECDVLGVAPNLKLIDVEIKISRADLKIDAKKNKWWRHNYSWRPWAGETDPGPKPRNWPPKVWKHYYCVPTEIWKPELAESVSPISGILLIRDTGPAHPKNVRFAIDVFRRCRANPDAKPIEANDAIDLARLASLRMWDSYDAADRLGAEIQEQKP